MSDILSSDEIQKIALATINAKGRATEDDIAKVVAWAERARIAAGLLERVLDGRLVVYPYGQTPPKPQMVFTRREQA